MQALHDMGTATASSRAPDLSTSRRGMPNSARVLPAHLLQLAARRLRDGVLPPRCYFWLDPGVPLRRQGCSA